MSLETTFQFWLFSAGRSICPDPPEPSHSARHRSHCYLLPPAGSPPAQASWEPELGHITSPTPATNTGKLDGAKNELNPPNDLPSEPHESTEQWVPCSTHVGHEAAAEASSTGPLTWKRLLTDPAGCTRRWLRASFTITLSPHVMGMLLIQKSGP